MNNFFGVLLILLGILIMRFNAKKQTEKANYTIYPMIPLVVYIIAIAIIVLGIFLLIS